MSKPKKTIKEISEILCEKLWVKTVIYTDVLIDEKWNGNMRFDAYDVRGFKTHEIFVDSNENYSIVKL